jgi:hypothetical protein
MAELVTVRAVSSVTTAGPLRSTAAATKDWRDKPEGADMDWARDAKGSHP